MSKTYTEYYFKATHEEGAIYMSGLSLPDPKAGPYAFVNCSIHPRLFKVLSAEYPESTFVGCDYPPLYMD